MSFSLQLGLLRSALGWFNGAEWDNPPETSLYLHPSLPALHVCFTSCRKL